MTTPSHAPVLLDRVVALLAPALDHEGAVLVDCTLGLGGHTEAVLQQLRPGPGHRHRPRHRGARAGRRAAAALRRPVHRRARGLRRDRRGRRRPGPRATSTRSSSTSASPRCSSTSASAASPTPRTPRSTCGWTAPPASPPPTCSTPTPSAELTRVLREYGEEKFARKIARAVVRAARGRALHHQRPAGRAALRRDPGAGAAYRGTPRQAHLPGAADGGQRRAGRAPARDARGHRRDRRRRPRRRRVLPLARGPAGQARLHRRDPPRRARGPAVRARGQRAGVPARHPRCRGQADEHEIEQNPRAASVRLRAIERVRPFLPRPGPAEESADEQSRRPGPQPRPAHRQRGRREGPPLRRPARPHPGPEGALRDPGEPGARRRRRRAAALQHLDAAGVLRGDRRSRSRPPTSPRASRRCRWSSRTCATRSGSRPQAQADGHGRAGGADLPDARRQRVAGEKVPAAAGGPSQPQPARRRSSRRSSRPRPTIVEVLRPSRRRPPEATAEDEATAASCGQRRRHDGRQARRTAAAADGAA